MLQSAHTDRLSKRLCRGRLPGVRAGNCTMDDVNRAVFNSLRVRFDLGLFDRIDDQPYWKLGAEAIGSEESRALNLKAAQSSLVLLANPKGVLPLKKGGKVAVLGPHGNATMTLVQHDTGQVRDTHPLTHPSACSGSGSLMPCGLVLGLSTGLPWRVGARARGRRRQRHPFIRLRHLPLRRDSGHEHRLHDIHAGLRPLRSEHRRVRGGAGGGQGLRHGGSRPGYRGAAPVQQQGRRRRG